MKLSRSFPCILFFALVPVVASAQPASEASAPVVGPPLVCAPLLLPALPASPARVIGGEAPARYLLGPSDDVVIDAGTAEGMRDGQPFFVRRLVHDRFMPRSVHGLAVHTAGVLTIVDAQPHVSIARITQPCDGVLAGDYLEPFVSPVVPAPLADGVADFHETARLVLADERQHTGASGSLMVLDRGTARGVRPGQALTIFREALDGAGPVLEVGRARVMLVRPDTALVRIEQVSDAVYTGDLVALHR
ncbi:MAG TPA: hypothetical protein VFX12_12210 [Vicinamibacterales bacterium]|nr:hypothetical protein [Vicinamibacterales bacterium]